MPDCDLDMDDLDNDREDEDIALLKKHVVILAEHFDTVHIFTTRHISDDEGTVSCNQCSGNWFARKGQISEWLLKQEEGTRNEVRSNDG